MAQVVGVQAPFPQTFATPPAPHTCAAVQVPQRRVPPQPSPMEPQFFACWVQEVGVQVGPGGFGLLTTPTAHPARAATATTHDVLTPARASAAWHIASFTKGWGPCGGVYWGRDCCSRPGGPGRRRTALAAGRRPNR